MLQPGDLIDIWVVDKALGSGGMGSVYRCHNRAANRILAAIKVLDSGLRRHPEAEARFIREAEILFQLDHPNIVKVRNVRTDVDPPYLEMEFVEGESLEARLQRGPRSLEESLTLMVQCASALKYMHERGVRHRDIKPANLLIQPDDVLKLVDFGLAMEANATRITQQGMAFGTVSYAPPEWIAPDTMDPTLWDMYALGVVFYEMLTGELAFPVSGQGSARQQAMQVIVGKQDHAPLDPGEHFHQDLRALIGDMTRAKPAERVPDMGEVERRIRSLMRAPLKDAGVTLMPGDLRSGQPATPRHATAAKATPILTPISSTERPKTRRRSRRWIGAGLLGVGALGMGLGLAALMNYDDGQRELRLIVSGSPPHDVRVEGKAPHEVASNVQTFNRFAVGSTVRVQWAQGGPECTVARCGDGRGVCPSFCTHGEEQVPIEPGPGVLAHELVLPEVISLTVDLPLPKIRRDSMVLATLADKLGNRTEQGVRFKEVEPGRYGLQIRVGDCPDDVDPCWPGGECTDRCVAHKTEVDVGVDMTLLEGIRIPSPPDPDQAPEEGVPPSPTPAPTTDEPEPAPAPKRSSAGSRVTVSQFATWLESNAEWQAGGTYASKDAAYLGGWTGAAPPDGTGGSMVGISFQAARAYCRSRGTDLPKIEDSPSRIGEGGIVGHEVEYRLNPKSDAPALLGWFEDEPDPNVNNVSDLISTAVFRCSRR